ncbi:glycoside hydrolase family 3 protein [Litchfieldia salsa]|uniref:Beta-glucosidase n=1 Tax=Litchfieldia salsa TaxID=930152 RepID=A0A1H0PXC2_9BACI|nr:glycoside hydrolase family 3 protein [Litchfieldia salsa]SDP09821.1 beta-glucosidase [Litchfieldia salsa]
MPRFKRLAKTCMVTVLGLAMLSTEFAHIAQANTDKEEIVFKKQVGGVFDGMPLFNGNPEHLEEFVDTYFEYTGLEGPAVYASGARNHYTLQQGENAGKKIPGALSAADNVQGVSTDFPSLIGMGQSWNKGLLSDIGKVIGNEKISTLKVKQGDSNLHPTGWGANPNDFSQTVAFTVVSDMRINPLSGRFDEGFSEDAYMSAEMIDTMAAGLGGTDQPESEDGFWMRAAVGTKHYSIYNAQWFRQSANNSAGARSIFEYQTKSPMKAVSSGAVSGVMTSFGRTNGIPNILSPYQILLNDNAKYGAYSSPDFNGDAHVFGENTFGNGYDTKYAVDRTHANILMILADAQAGRPSVNTAAQAEDIALLVDAVEKGVYGVTKEDLIETARSHVNQMVRVGIFNEVDENGIPKYYPFASDAKDVASTVSDYNDAQHQDIALRAAQESIVLLKNDGTLPLNKDQKAAISGIYADARFKTTYSVNNTPDLENSGNSPLLAIIKEIGSEKVSYQTGNSIIGLASKQNGETVTADVNASEEGSALLTTAESFNQENEAHLFELYDWGQEGSSLKSLLNNRWVTSPGKNGEQVGNTDNTRLNLTDNDWNLGAMIGDTSTIPPRLRIEQNTDQTVSIISNGYRTGFSGDFSNWYYSNGRFISTKEGKLVTTEPLTNVENAANRGDEVKYETHVVQDVGVEAAKRAAEEDYAIVFVGAIPRHSAGEGNDRSALKMSDADYQLVDKVSEAFAAEGKKTIVVVKSSFPVGMEEIQNNENVSAIVYQPYGGQYESYALADVLYGDYAPTGRLSSTWYKDITALPAINEYAIPEGNPSTLADVDPRFTVDMTNSDPIESKLTYMYTDAPVTYEFGYGLSFSNFEYSDFTVSKNVNSNKPFDVSVKVKNAGTVNTSEVVQLYINNTDSAYGEYAPQKQLVAFEKVQIAPGETKAVTLTVDPNDFAIWDVNLGDFIVESGQYNLMVGTSSEDIKDSKTVKVNGKSVKTLQDKTFNVFDHSFASNEVIYHEVSKDRTAASLKEEKVVGSYHSVRSKQDGAWVAIPQVNLSKAKKITASVASNVNSGQITLHIGSPDSEPFATIDVPVTDKVTYTAKNTEVQVNELGYVDVAAELTKKVKGTHDVYVVFKKADLRIDSLTLN